MKRKTKIVGLFLMIALLFFAIPGFGKVQASRQDDEFNGWGDIEDEIKKEEELDALANQTLEISKSGEYTVSFRNAELKGREGSLAIVNKTGQTDASGDHGNACADIRKQPGQQADGPAVES